MTFLHFTDSQAFDEMMKLFRHIVPFVLIAVMASYASAQNEIEIKTPERIVRMLENMPVSDIPQSGQFQCTELSGTIMFYTEARNGVTVQLGARLFSDGVRKAYDPVIVSFIERLWVELLLRKTTASQSSLLKEYGVRIVLNGYPLGSGSFNRLNQALDLINSMNYFGITTGASNEIDVFIRNTSSETLHIYIPASRDLLFPYDKKEHEELLMRELKSTKLSYEQQKPELLNISGRTDGIQVSGGDCYMIDSLRNDIFLTAGKRILWDPEKYPEETMRNILMGVAAPERLNGMILEITPHTYNREIGKFRIPLARFLGYVQQQGFRFYTGDVGRDGDKCQCLLTMYHPVYNYLHILSVKFAPGQLEPDGETVIKADLSTFIPQHNIKNLFQEK